MKPKLFNTAYLRLTAWYVAIIMTISLLFNMWVYAQARQELHFGLDQIVQAQTTGLPLGNFEVLIQQRLEESRQRLMVRLALFNLTVFGLGAGASYWLARRTMRPIEQAVDSQHRFTADASHELRTPLAAMKAEIEVGLRGKLSKAEAVELLRSNLEEIDRLGGLAEGLLALTQKDAPIKPVPVSLEDIAGKVAKRLQPLAQAKHIRLQRDLAPVIVAAGEAAADKIIGILLDNAIKYSPPKTTITIRTYRKDSYGYVAVTDQGMGIKASELSHIFERFYRADTSRSKTHVPGHGLGLSIAQKLTQSLNGTLTATSTPAQGSTFTLKLPIA